MDKQLFVTADTVAKDFGVSKGYAYRLIREMNRELKAQGYLTVAGRVSKKYYLETVFLRFPRIGRLPCGCHRS